MIQGSCLSPILFLMFINDLPKLINPSIKIKIFADDVKMYVRIESLLDELSLQNALNKLKAWAEIWQLQISISKCNTLHISSIRSNQSTNPQYFLGVNPLKSLEAIKDLGVIVDEHLTFNPHINSLVKKASARSYLIQKCFH